MNPKEFFLLIPSLSALQFHVQINVPINIFPDHTFSPHSLFPLFHEQNSLVQESSDTENLLALSFETLL